jgi:hypothetical protein
LTEPLLWGDVIGNAYDGKEIMKACKDCKYEIDAESAIQDCSHRWHNDSWDDMCCDCGLDKEMILK